MSTEKEKTRVQGEDIVVTVDEKVTLHATTHTLKVDLELKDFRTKNTNGKEKLPGDVAWDVSGDGMVVIDSSVSNQIDSDGMLDLLLTKKLVKVAMKSPLEGGMKTYTGNAYVTSFTKTSPAGEVATYSFGLTGSGDLKPVVAEGGE